MSRLPAGIVKTEYGTYRVQLKRQGVRLIKTHKTLKAAREWLDGQRAEMDRGLWIDPRKGNVTVSELFEAWMDTRDVSGSTRRTDRALWVSRVEPKWGKVRVDRISRPQVQAWVVGMPGASSTKEKALRVLRGVLAMATEEHRIARNPAEGVKVRGLGVRRSGRALTPEQVQALVAELKPRHRDIAVVLAVTGLRSSELAALDVRDVEVRGDRVSLVVRKRYVLDEHGRRALLDGTKRGTRYERVVPVVGDAVRIVKARAARRAPAAPLFTGSRGGRIDMPTWRRNSGWNAAVERLHARGVLPWDDVRPHDLRHTAITALLRAIPDVKAAQAWAGHATASITTDLYGHVMADSLNRAADALAATLTTKEETSED